MAETEGEKLVITVRTAISRRLARGVYALVAGGDSDVPSLPWRVPLRRLSRKELEVSFSEASCQIRRLAEWASPRRLGLEWETRLVGTTRQRVPTAVTVPDIDAAAEAAGRIGGVDWPSELGRARGRNDALAITFPSLVPRDRARALSQSRSMTDAQFGLVVAAGSWFLANDVSGMTPRSVPIPGFSGKWIDKAGNRSLVCLLSGKSDLGLAKEPKSFLFRYLDSDVCMALYGKGRSEYGVYVQGRPAGLECQPSLVWVVENLATFHNFPQVKDAVCIYGAGKAGCPVLGGVSWVRDAERVIYWGDMDADGLEILNAYRSSLESKV